MARSSLLAYVHARETRADADTAKVLTMDKARRFATSAAQPKTPNYITPRNPKATPATMMMAGITMFHQLGSGTVQRSGVRVCMP